MDGKDSDRHRVVEDRSWIVMDRHGGGRYPHRAIHNANGPTTSSFTCPGGSALKHWAIPDCLTHIVTMDLDDGD
jgi:hypothetical protein